jgi:hypothetical protein
MKHILLLRIYIQNVDEIFTNFAITIVFYLLFLTDDGVKMKAKAKFRTHLHI